MQPSGYVAMAVRITKVHAGSLRVGQIISPDNLFSHLTPGTGLVGKYREPLARGERVLLFLTDRPKLACVHESMFQLVHGDLCPFGIEEPPSTLTWRPPRLNRNSPTLREMAVGIRDCLPQAARWHAMIDAPLNPKSVSILLSHLQQRTPPGPNYFWHDAISDAAAARLASCNDPEIADKTMAATGGRAYFRCEQAFQSRRGRDFLLSHLTDSKIDVQHRLMLARMLRDVGAVYASQRVQAATRPWSPGTIPDPNNSWYLTRIARVAASTAEENAEVSVAGLDSLHQLTFRGWDPTLPVLDIQADIDGVAEVLREIYKKPGTTGAIRFGVEKTIAGIDYASYLALHSRCGPVLTLAKPLDLTHYGAPSAPSIMLAYESDCVLPLVNGRMPPMPKVTATYLVLTPVGGGVPYLLPAAMVGSQYPNFSGGECVALPVGCRPGNYQIHYRLMNGNTIVLPPQPRDQILVGTADARR